MYQDSPDNSESDSGLRTFGSGQAQPKSHFKNTNLEFLWINVRNFGFQINNDKGFNRNEGFYC